MHTKNYLCTAKRKKVTILSIKFFPSVSYIHSCLLKMGTFDNFTQGRENDSTSKIKWKIIVCGSPYPASPYIAYILTNVRAFQNCTLFCNGGLI